MKPDGGAVRDLPRTSSHDDEDLPIDDIARAYEDLTGRGVSFGYQNDPDLGTDAKGIYWGLDKGEGPNIAWFRDPAGNVLSVVQDRDHARTRSDLAAIRL